MTNLQEWERGYHDDAFVSLDKALECARALEIAIDKNEHCYTAELVKFVRILPEPAENYAKSLPDNWPFWCNPDYSQVEKEIKADPRWQTWVEKTQE